RTVEVSSQKRAPRRPFLLRELGEKGEQLDALGITQARSHTTLVPLDALAQAEREYPARTRQPQAVGAPVAAAAPLDQAALFQQVNDAHHGRAIEAHRLGEPALR